jgi:hypothetical protein
VNKAAASGVPLAKIKEESLKLIDTLTHGCGLPDHSICVEF